MGPDLSQDRFPFRVLVDTDNPFAIGNFRFVPKTPNGLVSSSLIFEAKLQRIPPFCSSLVIYWIIFGVDRQQFKTDKFEEMFESPKINETRTLAIYGEFIDWKAVKEVFIKTRQLPGA